MSQDEGNQFPAHEPTVAGRAEGGQTQGAWIKNERERKEKKERERERGARGEAHWELALEHAETQGLVRDSKDSSLLISFMYLNILMQCINLFFVVVLKRIYRFFYKYCVNLTMNKIYFWSDFSLHGFIAWLKPCIDVTL